MKKYTHYTHTHSKHTHAHTKRTPQKSGETNPDRCNNCYLTNHLVGHICCSYFILQHLFSLIQHLLQGLCNTLSLVKVLGNDLNPGFLFLLQCQPIVFFLNDRFKLWSIVMSVNIMQVGTFLFKPPSMLVSTKQ